MRYRDPELCELLAAQYAMGTLGSRARRRFEGLLPGRPDLRRRVQAWETRLPELMGTPPAVAPPPEVWAGLRRRLFPCDALKLAFWRGWAATASLVACAFALVLVLGREAEVPAYVTVISSMQSQKPMWLVSASPEMDRLYVKSMQAMDMSPEIGCVLWIKPEGSDRVYALGKLPWRGNDGMLEVERAMRPMLKGELLVTVEPVGERMPETPSVAPGYAGQWIPIKL